MKSSLATSILPDEQLARYDHTYGTTYHHCLFA
jgi:hypothetical protein